MLIKHGEDVRQDERIMQLLRTIDVALVHDRESRKRNLSVRTFEVCRILFIHFIADFVTDALVLQGDPAEPDVRNVSMAGRHGHPETFPRNGFQFQGCHADVDSPIFVVLVLKPIHS